MSKRMLVVDIVDFTKCIGSGAIKCETFSEGFAKDVRELAVGAFVVALRGYETNVRKKMFLTMWRCRGDNVNCLVSKMELDGLKSKLKTVGSEGCDVEMAIDN